MSSVYFQGTDFISDTDEVRRLARKVVTADFSDGEIESWQFKEYSYIRTVTDKDDWDALDREYGALQGVETKLAAADIIEHYGRGPDALAAVQSMRESAYARLESITENLDTTTEESGSVLETDNKSWNLNELVSPPNRLSNVGISEVDF